MELSLDYILRSAYATSDDVVVVAGSLIEGLGNAQSDIDVYVITDELRRVCDLSRVSHHRVITVDREVPVSPDDDRRVLLIHTVIPGTNVKLDVEFRTFGELATIVERVDSTYQYAIKTLMLLAPTFADRDESMLHRLFSGVVIQNRRRLDRIMTCDRWQLCYLLYRWKASDFSVLLDIMGAWGVGDGDRAVDLARENVITQMHGLLHLYGETVGRRKWMPRLLCRLPAQCDSLKSRFRSLFYLQDVSSAGGVEPYVLSAIDFVDEIFSHSVQVLELNPWFPSGASAIRQLRRNCHADDIVEVYAAMEFAYRAKVYGVPGVPTREWLGAFGSQGPPEVRLCPGR